MCYWPGCILFCFVFLKGLQHRNQDAVSVSIKLADWNTNLWACFQYINWVYCRHLALVSQVCAHMSHFNKKNATTTTCTLKTSKVASLVYLITQVISFVFFVCSSYWNIWLLEVNLLRRTFNSAAVTLCLRCRLCLCWNGKECKCGPFGAILNIFPQATGSAVLHDLRSRQRGHVQREKGGSTKSATFPGDPVTRSQEVNNV